MFSVTQLKGKRPLSLRNVVEIVKPLFGQTHLGTKAFTGRTSTATLRHGHKVHVDIVQSYLVLPYYFILLKMIESNRFSNGMESGIYF